MVLTSSGKILTNNHVIRGATQITVVVPETSRTYTAKVVGYAVTDDVAVLRARRRLEPRHGEDVRRQGRLSATVTAVGNGGGTGRLHSVTGEITTLRRSIIVRDDARGAVRLNGVMGASADVEPGDSGGPLFNSADAVIGMNTAGSSGYASRSTTQAYAIPIARALSIVRSRSTPDARSTRIHIGATPFLGISIASSSSNGDFTTPGAVVASVVRGGPAANAGRLPRRCDHGDRRPQDLLVELDHCGDPRQEARRQGDDPDHGPRRRRALGDRDARRAAPLSKGEGSPLIGVRLRAGRPRRARG